MPEASPEALLVTCEHGGNRVPARYRELFRGHERLLASHRGWDPGALGVARRLARRLRAPFHSSTVTRLLVELNRSLGHRDLFSPIVMPLDDSEKARIVRRFWEPYRAEVEDTVRRLAGSTRHVLHLSVHSFTPVFHGEVRDVDIGILYDPARRGERELAARWRAILREIAPKLRVRRNAPYRGAADGLTTSLRRRFPARRYLGIEVEISQRFFRDVSVRSGVVRAVEDSFVSLAAERAGRLRESSGHG